MKILRFILSLALVLGVNSLSQAQEKNISKSYSGIDKIEFNVIAGNIKIGASNTDQVQVTGTYNEEQIRVKMSNSNGKLIIEEKSKSNRINESSTWTLLIPSDISVKSNSASGNVTVEGVQLNLHTNTGSGNFVFTGVSGYLQLNTGSGNVDIDNSNAEFACNTGSGNIGVKESTGRLGLNTGSGQISLQNSGGTISANTGSGQVKGKGMTITGSSSFNTGSGNVIVSLAGLPKADFSVNAGSGNSTLDMNGISFQGQLVMQCNEKNGKISAPFSFDQEKVIERNGRNNNILRKTKRFGNSNIKIQVSTGSGAAKVSAVK